jgi:hypothetical protein
MTQVLLDRRLLKKFGECASGREGWPRGDCDDYGKQQRFNRKLHGPFAGEIGSCQFAKCPARF